MLNNIIAIPPVNNFVIGVRMKTTNRLGWMKTKRKPLSDADREAAQNLRRIWDKKKSNLKLTQDAAAEKLGFTTQGAVSHYLNGYTPLNTDAVLKFAALLEVQPDDIRPDIGSLLGSAVAPTADGLSDIGREFVTWLIGQYKEGSLTDPDILVLKGRAEQMAESRAKPEPIKTFRANDLRKRQSNFEGKDRRQPKERGDE